MRPVSVLRPVLASLALGAGLCSARGDETVRPPAAVAPAPPGTWTPQQKASLEVLDRALARFDQLLARDDDTRHQAATRGILDGLKRRRAALRASFDQGKYDDLRTELDLEFHRLAAWVGPATAPP
jgi:hypothetical protein